MRDYKSVSIHKELVNKVEQLIRRLGTYRSVSEFVKEAVRLRVEALEKLKAEIKNEQTQAQARS